jgi:hypothetical protein
MLLRFARLRDPDIALFLSGANFYLIAIAQLGVG